MRWLLAAAALAGVTALALLDVPRLRREKRWRELTAYATLWVPGAVLSALQAAGTVLPGPVQLELWVIRGIRQLAGHVLSALGLG